MTVSYEDNHCTKNVVYMFSYIILQHAVRSPLSLCLSINLSVCLSLYIYMRVSVCVYIYIFFYVCMHTYIYIYIHTYTYIRGAFNKFPDFFLQAFKIVVDS